MRRPMVMFASLMAMAPLCAEGKTLGHFGIGLKTDFGAIPSSSTPSSLSSTSQASMTARAADEQLARQTGVCANAWTERFSSQCPPGSFMALQAHGTILGLTVPFSSCQPVGCLHTQAQQGEDDLRDDGELLLEAVAMEVAMLVDRQPGMSFEKHLAAMRKNFLKESAVVKAILASLLREASAGERAATTATMRFFVEMAAYRGFVGPEVDQTWASLDAFNKDEMALEFDRRTSQLVMARFGPVMAKVGWESNTKAETICQQEGGIFDARKETLELFTRSSTKLAREKEVAEKEVNVASELYTVHQLLDKERTEKAAAVEATEKAKAETIAVRFEALTNATKLTSERSDIKQLLNIELAAKAAAATEVEEVKTEVSVVRFEAATNVVTLSSQLSDALHLLDNERADKAAAAETVNTKIAALRSEAANNMAEVSAQLSDVQQLLHKELADKAAAVAEVEEINAIMAGVDTDLNEAYEANARLVEELKESKITRTNTCDKRLEDKEAIIAQLEESFRVEGAVERAQQGEPREWPIQREKAMRHIRACKVQTKDLVEKLEFAVASVVSCGESLNSIGDEGVAFRDAAYLCSNSLKKERLAHQQLLASRSSSDDVCECLHKEVSAVDGAENASESGAPTP